MVCPRLKIVNIKYRIAVARDTMLQDAIFPGCFYDIFQHFAVGMLNPIRDRNNDL